VLIVALFLFSPLPDLCYRKADQICEFRTYLTSYISVTPYSTKSILFLQESGGSYIL